MERTIVLAVVFAVCGVSGIWLATLAWAAGRDVADRYARMFHIHEGED